MTWWTPLRVLLAVTALTFALGMVQKSGCYSTSWTNNDVRYSQMCYSDLPYLYTGRGFAELAWPYSDDPTVRERYEVMEYPVGIAYWAWGTAWVTHWIAGSPDLEERKATSPDGLWGLPEVYDEVTLYVVVNALGLAVLALACTWLLAMVRQRRPGEATPGEATPRGRLPIWAVMGFAASPMLLFSGLVNWDLLAVVCVAGAMAAWSRDRPVWTGIAIGVGTAVKLYPLFLLGAVLVIAIRRRDLRPFVLACVAAALSWLVVNAPAMLTGYDEWKVFWTFNSTRPADLGSLWLVIQQATGHGFSAHAINVWSWVLFGGWCAVVLVLGLRARRMPTFSELGFVIVAGFLIVNKVYSPQYVLWLLPLAVIARPRLRDQAWWQAGEFFYFAAVWWYLGGFLAPGAGEDQPFYWLAILTRVAVEIWLIVLIFRTWRRAEEPASSELSTSEGIKVVS